MDVKQPSRLDRALRLFSDVRPGEGVTVVLLALNILVILQAYYLLKPVREALILGQGSAELKSYMAVGQVALLLLVVPLYGRLVARVPRLKLIRIVTWFFVACLLTFYTLAQMGVPLGIPYFLWIGIFSLMIVAQFWAFANDLYTKEEGERLFPIVGFGASLGAVVGALVSEQLIGPLSVYQVMLVGAALLAAQLQITAYIDRRQMRFRSARATAEAPQPGGNHNAFALVFGSPYLLGIALMILAFYLFDATGEYILGSIVKDRASELVASGRSDGLPVEAIIGRFYSRYYGLVNTSSLLLQLFVVSRVIKYLGVGTAIRILPALATVVYITIAFMPGLGFMLAAIVSQKSTDYSLNNTVRNMLFLPCTREEKYSAKQVIDSLFVRLGDVASAALVFIGTGFLGLSALGFAKFNIGVCLVALVLAVFVGRGYMQRTERQQAAAERPAGRQALRPVG